MNIIETNFKFNKNLSNRNQTTFIILHHRAGNGDVASIHAQHLQSDFIGIGYHYYIRKNGSIYRGRPEGTIGAHCSDYNNNSIGVCFEGNFENEKMNEIQRKAGKELINQLKSTYKSAAVLQHNKLSSTVCPGKYFPFDDIANDKNSKKELISSNDIIWELKNGKYKLEINDVNTAVICLEKAKQQNSSLYWILYKLVNKE